MNNISKLCENPHLLHLSVKHTAHFNKEKAAEVNKVLNVVLPRHPSLMDPLYKETQVNIWGTLFGQPIHLDIIKCLIQNGFDIRKGNDRTILHQVADYLSPDDLHEFCRILLEECDAGDLFQRKADSWESPLEYLIVMSKNLKAETLDLIMSKIPGGIDLNDRDIYGCDILGNAAGTQLVSLDLTKALVNHGANYQLVHPGGKTLLHLAAISGNIEALEYFMSLGLSPNDKDNRGQPPILHAFLHLAVIKFLALTGSDVYAVDVHGYTIAHRAASALNESEFHELIVFLLENENYAPILKMKTNSLMSPLHIRLRCWGSKLRPDTLKLLLDNNGECVNDIDEWGNNLFLSAVSGNESAENLEILVKWGTDYNAVNSDGQNAIRLAVGALKSGAMRYLLSLGIDANRLDLSGFSPVELAQMKFMERTHTGSRTCDMLHDAAVVLEELEAHLDGRVPKEADVIIKEIPDRRRQYQEVWKMRRNGVQNDVESD